jgi:hypothetical protein
LVIIVLFFPSNAKFADEMQDLLDDNEWQKCKDDKLWAQEVSWAKKFQQQNSSAPKTFAKGD